MQKGKHSLHYFRTDLEPGQLQRAWVTFPQLMVSWDLPNSQCSFSVSWVLLGIFLQEFSQITGNMARIALPFSLTPVLEHFCQKSRSHIHPFLWKVKRALNRGVNASDKVQFLGLCSQSMLIKINIDISSEFILEMKTISAETDKNTLRPNQISGIGKFFPYSKE